MSEYTLSVVQLCPDAYVVAANAVAEEAGYGPNNLSVKLRHTDGSTWWGCHAWWVKEVFDSSTNPDNYPPEIAAVLSNVVSFSGENLIPRDHWAEALNNTGLSVVEE